MPAETQLYSVYGYTRGLLLGAGNPRINLWHSCCVVASLVKAAPRPPSQLQQSTGLVHWTSSRFLRLQHYTQGLPPHSISPEARIGPANRSVAGLVDLPAVGLRPCQHVPASCVNHMQQDLRDPGCQRSGGAEQRRR
jgi:hypothetical protein